MYNKVYAKEIQKRYIYEQYQSFHDILVKWNKISIYPDKRY